MKVKLHSRIKIAVEFSDVGVIKPNGEFEVDEKRAEELIQLEYVEPIKKTKPKSKQETDANGNSKNSTEANDGVGSTADAIV